MRHEVYVAELLRNSPPSRRAARPQSNHNRAGATLVVMVIGLLLVGLAAAALVQAATRQRSVLKSETTRLQAEWLATSAGQRAALSLQAKADYAGEVWNVAPEELGSSEGARIEIKVRPDPANDKVRLIAIRVEQPPGEQAIVRVSREIKVRAK